MSETIRLMDSSCRIVATARVERNGRQFVGTIEFDTVPPDIRCKFEDLEALVEQQVFSLTDEIEDEIAALGMRVGFEDGASAPVEDLQVFPRAGTISFRAKWAAAVPARG